MRNRPLRCFRCFGSVGNVLSISRRFKDAEISVLHGHKVKRPALVVVNLDHAAVLIGMDEGALSPSWPAM
jgi:hypothetical protein